MRLVNRLFDATVVLVIVFGLLGLLLTGSRTASRALVRRRSRLDGAQAWVSGFGGSMGWDGSPHAPSREPAPKALRTTDH